MAKKKSAEPAPTSTKPKPAKKRQELRAAQFISIGLAAETTEDETDLTVVFRCPAGSTVQVYFCKDTEANDGLDPVYEISDTTGMTSASVTVSTDEVDQVYVAEAGLYANGNEYTDQAVITRK